VKGSRYLLLEFWDHIHISGMVEGRKFKIGTNIDHPKPVTKKCKIKSKWARKGSRDLLLKCWDSIHIFRTGKAKKTSNLACT